MKSIALIVAVSLICSGSFFAQSKYTCEEHYTIFNSALVNKDYLLAKMHWHALVSRNCDEILKQREKITSNGGIMLQRIIDRVSGAEKNRLIDSLIWNQKLRLNLFQTPEEKESLGLLYRKYTKQKDSTLKYLNQSFGLLREHSKPASLHYYYFYSIDVWQQKSLSDQEMFLRFRGVRNTVRKNQSKSSDDQIQKLLERVNISVGTQLGCEFIHRSYHEQLNQNPLDTVLVDEIIEVLESSGCSKVSELVPFYLELKLKRLQKNPAAVDYLQLSDAFRAAGDNNKADSLFKESLKRAVKGSEEQQLLYHRSLQYFKYEFADQWVLDIPDDGRAWLNKARKLVLLVNDVRVDPDLTIRRLVYSRAMDYCEHAIKVDPSVQQEAKDLIEEFTKHLPMCSELFQRGKTKGDTINLKLVGEVKIRCNTN